MAEEANNGLYASSTKDRGFLQMTLNTRNNVSVDSYTLTWEKVPMNSKGLTSEVCEQPDYLFEILDCLSNSGKPETFQRLLDYNHHQPQSA